MNYKRAATVLVSTIALSCCLGTTSHAQLRLDSYGYLLRDVHPASYAQAQYVRNRLFLTEVKKAERNERLSRSDILEERWLIKRAGRHLAALGRLSAGYSTDESDWTKLWTLIAVYGTTDTVYDALRTEVSPLPSDEFVPASTALSVIGRRGRLSPPPAVLIHYDKAAAWEVGRSWLNLVGSLDRPVDVTSKNVTRFQESVRRFSERNQPRIKYVRDGEARVAARAYLRSLDRLAAVLHRPRRCEQLRAYLEPNGFSFPGGDRLALCHHLLKYGAIPARGGQAQLATAGVTRPLFALVEKEIGIRRSRIDRINHIGSYGCEPITYDRVNSLASAGWPDRQTP